jgi:hypothetical protein
MVQRWKIGYENLIPSNPVFQHSTIPVLQFPFRIQHPDFHIPVSAFRIPNSTFKNIKCGRAEDEVLQAKGL